MVTAPMRFRNHLLADQKKPLSFPAAFVALAVGACAMGISPVFVRYAEVGPFASAFWRVALALPLLMLWALAEQGWRWRDLRAVLTFDRPILLAGLFFAGDLVFWHLAILQTTIANATLMACLAPVWVMLLSGLFIGEKVPLRAVFGIAICLAGAALLIGSSLAIAPERLLGDLFGVITSIFFGLYFLAVRVARRRHEAGAMTLMSTTVTAAVLLCVVLLSGQGLVPHSLTGILALLALGFIAHSGGQGLLAVALGSLSAVFSSLVIFIEALAAALAAWIIFSEALTPMQLGGGVLILAGIWMSRPRSDES